MKRCANCKVIKNEKDFYNDKKSSDGLTYSCKLCRRNEKRAWKAAKLNKEVEEAYYYNKIAWTKKGHQKKMFNTHGYQKSLNMMEVYKYDEDYNLIDMYENVLEAVLEESGINSTDIYKACLKERRRIQGFRWSFDQVLPEDITLEIYKWIEDSKKDNLIDVF